MMMWGNAQLQTRKIHFRLSPSRSFREISGWDLIWGNQWVYTVYGINVMLEKVLLCPPDTLSLMTNLPRKKGSKNYLAQFFLLAISDGAVFVSLLV